MYAIVKTGGKQYRVEQGQWLLVERLRAVAEGDSVALQPLLVVDGDSMVDGEGLSRATVSARVVAHERGPKLRVVKFKPKRGYKRRTGHRQELTRLEVTEVKLGAAQSRAKAKPAAEAGDAAAAGAAEKPRSRAKPAAEKPAGEKPTAEKPAGEAKPRARTRKPPATKETENGS